MVVDVVVVITICLLTIICLRCVFNTRSQRFIIEKGHNQRQVDHRDALAQVIHSLTNNCSYG